MRLLAKLQVNKINIHTQITKRNKKGLRRDRVSEDDDEMATIVCAQRNN